MNRFKRKYSIWNVVDLMAWASFFVSNYLTEFYYHLFVPSIYLIVRAILRRMRIKTDLKNAVDYCRVSQPLWKTVIGVALVVVIGLTVAYAYQYLENFLKMLIPKATSAHYGFIVVTGFLATLLVARLHNFTRGVRWYISGIKLPGERSLLIPWRLVDDVKLEGRTLHVSTLGTTHVFRMKEEDISSAHSFERWFQKKTQIPDDVAN